MPDGGQLPGQRRHAAPPWLRSAVEAALPPFVAFAGLLGFFNPSPWLALAAAVSFGFAVSAWRHAQPRRGTWIARGVLSLIAAVLIAIVITRDSNDGPPISQGPTPAIPPVAVVRTSIESGPAPLRIVFDGSQSRDPDSDAPLIFSWDLNGDGSFDDATTVRPVYIYRQAGEYAARLRVGDGGEESFSEPIRISVAEPSKPPPKTAERLTFSDVPASAQALGLTISVGESELRGEALEDTLVRLVARTETAKCVWRNVVTGDRFMLTGRRRRFRIDAFQVGYTSAHPNDASLVIRRYEVVEEGDSRRCREE